MICLVAGAGAVILAVFIVGLLLAYLLDWDRVIREATEQIEEEWRQEARRIPYDTQGGCP